MSKNPAKISVGRKPLFRTKPGEMGGREGPRSSTPLRHHCSHRATGAIQKRRRRRLGTQRGRGEAVCSEEGGPTATRNPQLGSAVAPLPTVVGAGTEEGIRLPQCGEEGLRLPQCGEEGLRLPQCGEEGLRLPQCGEEGIRLPQCGEEGLRLPQCGEEGLRLPQCGEEGLRLPQCGEEGLRLPQCGEEGLRLPQCGEEGLRLPQCGEEEDLMTGICPEDFSFVLDISASVPLSGAHQPPARPSASAGPEATPPPPSAGGDVGVGQTVCLIPESPPPGGGGRGEEGGEGHTFFGLPLVVKPLLQKHRGITQLYDWQEQCLSLPHVLEGGNLLYCLPTSGGKTLVAEILILRQLLLRQRDVLLILPFVSIVQEKVRDLAPFASALGFAVEEYAASRGQIPPQRRRRKRVVYVATIEKASGLINSLIELERLQTVGLVVVDELHMLGDGSVRGATLETCLTKIFCLASSTQIVAMSATLSNTSDIATFLRAEVYCSDFRPVELREYVKLGRCVYSVQQEEGGRGDVRLLPDRDLAEPQNRGRCQADPDQLVGLVEEVLPHSSCLVFCATKKACQNAALLLARQLPRSQRALHSAARSALLRSLATEASGVCPVLACTVPVGVAYHHSGLMGDERRLVEEGFSRGELSVLVCTSTLAAGVNLPARRVILRSPYIGSQLLSHTQYKQMVGRAGRKGLSCHGESILMARENERDKVMQLLCSPYDRCESSLMSEGGSILASFVLSLVGLKLTQTTSDLHSFLKATLYYLQSLSSDHTPFLSRCQDTIANLVSKGYITMETVVGASSRLRITALGQATYKGCLPVEVAGDVWRELIQAQRCLVLSTNLHLLFLATPTNRAPSIRPNWLVFFQTLTGLGPEELRVAEVVGVSPALLGKLATGTGGNLSEQATQVYHRFYLSLMIYRLLSEATQHPGGVAKEVGGVWSVAEHFQCSRGFLQSAITSVASFASCLVHFTQELPELWALHQLLPSVARQLSHSASADLIPLMEIPGVRQGRARQLLQAGYPTPQAVACLSPSSLCQSVEHLFPPQARRIIQAAKVLLEERAEVLLEEAEDLMASLPKH